jgi:hypothetical protein
MMTGSVMLSACRAGECLLAGAGSAPGPADARGLADATLVSWLCAELLGVVMLRSWIASGGVSDRQARPRGLSPALIFGHAGLALAGLTSWISFLVTESVALAWTSIGFLAPAIGLGISTVTVWTPFPVRRPRPGETLRRLTAADEADPAVRDGPAELAVPAILVPNEMLDRALENEALADQLVDDLLSRMLADPAPPPRKDRGWQLAPVIPILHGVLAIVTILLAMLAAVVAIAR